MLNPKKSTKLSKLCSKLAGMCSCLSACQNLCKKTKKVNKDERRESVNLRRSTTSRLAFDNKKIKSLNLKKKNTMQLSMAASVKLENGGATYVDTLEDDDEFNQT